LGLGGHGADGDASAGDDSDEPPVTSVSIGHGAPADMAAQVTAHIESRRAFARFKIKVGASADADQAGLDAIRAVTDRPLVADANGGFADREDAARRIEVLAARGVEWIEQPLSAGRLEDVAWLRRRTPIPILADEDVLTAADVVRAAAAYDGVNIKLMKAGGVTAALAQVEIARACGLRVLLGCAMQSSLAATAAAHLAPLFDWIDLDAPLFLARDPFEGLDYGPGGRLLLPGRPGIGARRRG
jgi:L-alanine-DL-glutamate epimerase-like enolase superfamily enzyme